MSSEMVFFGFLAAVILIPSLAHYWSTLRIKEWELSLKHAMLERGMSADEIERVLRASAGSPEKAAE